MALSSTILVVTTMQSVMREEHFTCFITFKRRGSPQMLLRLLPLSLEEPILACIIAIIFKTNLNFQNYTPIDLIISFSSIYHLFSNTNLYSLTRVEVIFRFLYLFANTLSASYFFEPICSKILPKGICDHSDCLLDKNLNFLLKNA